MRKIFDSLLGRSKKTELVNELDKPSNYFKQIYSKNLWGGASSRSGLGSERDFAKQKVDILTKLIAENGITSILDLGCGDLYWMKEIIPLIDHYHGIDVVKQLVKQNKKRFGGQKVTFQCLDLSNAKHQKRLTVRDVDLIVCLDVFGHLLNSEVDSLLEFILYEITARFFLVTNRREPGSLDYLNREKTRNEGIDLEQHPLFVKRQPNRLKQIPGLYPNDFFELYDLTIAPS